MAIVDFFQGRGFKIRVGGSLSAAMFGGPRKPVDIDFDVPSEDLDRVKERFMMLQKGVSLVAGRDLFIIKAMTKTSAGVAVTCLHVVANEEVDPFAEEEEIEGIVQKANDPVTFEVVVDFTPEEMFKLSGLVVDKEAHGYYGERFLIAAYLNRLAQNMLESKTDPKNDRGQIVGILSRLLSEELARTEGGMGQSAMGQFLTKVLEQIFVEHIDKSHKNLSVMRELAAGIIEDVIGRMYFI